MIILKKTICMLLILTALFTFYSCSDNTGFESKAIVSDILLSEKSDDSIIPDLTSVEKRISFLGCGDNIIYGGNIKDARSKATSETRSLNFKPHYEKVLGYIQNADIAFINQETLMCGEGYAISYYPQFNSPQELGYDLAEIGYDVVNIANNHMLDKGASGLEKTIDFWNSFDDVTLIGGYKNEDDFDNIRIVEKEGIRIAFLSYTYATNGLSKSASSEIVIPYINDDDIVRHTAIAKECSDFIIVSVHWGDEGSFKPNAEQKRVAKLLADNGVDVIVGHHPHVLQPVEWIERDDGKRTLCVYSLGNFVGEQAYDYNMVGGMISFDIVRMGKEAPYVENVLLTPTVFHFPSDFYTNIVYPLEEYTPELAGIHGVKNFYRHTLTYERLINYAKDTISEEFLPEFFHEEENN